MHNSQRQNSYSLSIKQAQFACFCVLIIFFIIKAAVKIELREFASLFKDMIKYEKVR
jgi:hypothetical protein